jgi:hypothetical protein
VFLVFLTKTYFTRKWCIKELQEAIARQKHIVFVLDTDERHGGVTTLEQLVAYAHKQEDRKSDDQDSGASNLFNADVAGSTECAELGRWVMDHVSSAGGTLKISAFNYKGPGMDQQRVGPFPPPVEPCPEVLHREDTPGTVVRWHRPAEWKRVSLQLIVEDVLKAKCWEISREERELALPLPRVQLQKRCHRAAKYHVAVSGRHVPSQALITRLQELSRKEHLKVLHMEHETEVQSRQCPCMVVVMDEGLVSNQAYQADVRKATDANVKIILVQDWTKRVGDTSNALWDKMLRSDSDCPFSAEQIRAIFNPISIRCQPQLLQGAAHLTEYELTKYDESSLAQIEHGIASAQPFARTCSLECTRSKQPAVMQPSSNHSEALCQRNPIYSTAGNGAAASVVRTI